MQEKICSLGKNPQDCWLPLAVPLCHSWSKRGAIAHLLRFQTCQRMGDQVFTVIPLWHSLSPEGKSVLKSPVGVHSALRAPWLGLEDNCPPRTETHQPKAWLKGQRPSYIISFAAPGLKSSICSFLLRVKLLSFSLLQPWMIHQY